MTILIPLFLMFFSTACASDAVPSPAATLRLQPASTQTGTLAPATATPLPPTLTPTFERGLPSPTVTATPAAILQLCSPLEGDTLAELFEIISDPYAPPPAGKDERHHGVDLAYYRREDRLSIEGVTVQALLPGVVAAAIADRLPYGNMVIIETPLSEIPPDLAAWLGLSEGESLYHLYAHFGQSPLVQRGERVLCGQPLGMVGRTGYNIVEPHLHLETRIGPAGTTFESMAYYTTQASAAERAAYELWRTSGVYRHFDPMTLIGQYLQLADK